MSKRHDRAQEEPSLQQRAAKQSPRCQYQLMVSPDTFMSPTGPVSGCKVPKQAQGRLLISWLLEAGLGGWHSSANSHMRQAGDGCQGPWPLVVTPTGGRLPQPKTAARDSGRKGHSNLLYGPLRRGGGGESHVLPWASVSPLAK